MLRKQRRRLLQRQARVDEAGEARAVADDAERGSISQGDALYVRGDASLP